MRGMTDPKPRRKAQWDANGVRGLRSFLGMTQHELAGELGTRQQTISEWETGQYAPRGASARLLTVVAEQAGFAYQTSSEIPSTEVG
ncbi:MAG: helix-turn-helix domain-containing protein [Dehalococcoidia bacterium]|nr:helix-turn-helix domain-containing protein [Dehalococcoidia bacterium]